MYAYTNQDPSDVNVYLPMLFLRGGAFATLTTRRSIIPLLWICVFWWRNTDPRRLCVRGGPKVVDLCSPRAKHRATQLVLVFFESGSWICGSVFLARGVGHRGRCFYDLNAKTGC